MKKVLTIALASLLAASLLAPASAAPKKQTVEGTVVTPLPFIDDSGCFAGAHRRIAIITQEQVNGITGYHFEVEKFTEGGTFTLEPTGGLGEVDLDIYFYQEFGTVDDVINDPGGAGAPATVQFNTREPGGEAGEVPPGHPKVIVCMYGGQQGGGAGASFVYEATAPVKKKKKK